jgi:hypothetical protein
VKFGSVEQITELLEYNGNNLPPTLALIVK